MTALPFHFKSTDVLHGCVRFLRRIVGAPVASLYIPSLSGGESEPLLIHDGDDQPVAELVDHDAAVTFCRRYDAECRTEADGLQDGVSLPLLQCISNSSSGGLLIRVIPPRLIPQLSTAGLDDPEPKRRAVDYDRVPSSHLPAVWIGLRLKAEDDIRLSAILENLATTPEFGQWWDWLIALGAALALHTQQISAVVDDPVSGLPGRIQLEACLAQAIERSVKLSRPFVLLLINPDDFEVVNEHFGREACDTVLREIAERLTGFVSGVDLVYRYGGAIFAIVLPDTQLDDGTLVSERLRCELAEGAYCQGTARLGFSFGLSEFVPSEYDDAREVGIDLFRKADQALYVAKEAGGGRIVTWQVGAELKEVGSVDRLSGIFTANLAKDYRNMLLLWDMLAIIFGNPNPEELANEAVKRLLGAFKPERVALFLTSEEGELRPVAVRTNPPSNGLKPEEMLISNEQRLLLEEALAGKDPLERVLNISDVDEPVVCCVVPLVSQGTCLGCLYLDGGRIAMTLESSDLLFLKALSDQLAVTIDHARLAAEDRLRQEEQRHRLRAELNDLRRALGQARLVSRSPEMESVLATVRRVAPTSATVLITGESGTGKELLARTIHEMSGRKDKPFVVVDCGAIAASLIDSELFGREKGAYTGAHDRARGRLSEADGGTVVLDEIGELPVEAQSKLLRFVQEKQIIPVGGTRAYSVDVRLIAITNRDLGKEVKNGQFREDLFHRLNVVGIESPPLRDRPDDILYLVEHFLNLYSIQYQKSVHRFSREAESRIMAYQWPGNIRELQNRVMKAVILSEGAEIELGALGIGETEGDSPAPMEPLPLVPATIPAPTAHMPGPTARYPAVSETAATGRATPPMAPSHGSSRDGELEPEPVGSAWTALAAALDRLVKEAAGRGRRVAVPFGRWLAEDLVLQAYDAADGVYNRGAVILGIAESTFRRRANKARADADAGLVHRSADWNAVCPLIAGWLRSGHDNGENRLDRARLELLAKVAVRIPDDISFAAALMGVTLATYRSWLSNLSSRN